MNSAARAGLWYLRQEQLLSGLWAMLGYETEEHPDGEVVQAAVGEEPSPGWTWRTLPTDRGIIRIERGHDVLPDAPALWYVNVDEPTASKPATNLVAFATEHREPGTIVSRYTFASLGVNNNLQVGAVRWYRTGIVHQVFVTPSWRRQFVATLLLGAADAFHQANGWPNHVRSDGRRTRLGQLLAAGIRQPGRFAPLSEPMPSMDQAE